MHLICRPKGRRLLRTAQPAEGKAIQAFLKISHGLSSDTPFGSRHDAPSGQRQLSPSFRGFRERPSGRSARDQASRRVVLA
jgi:hypothetical protein